MTGGPNTTFSRRSSTSTSGKAHCASTTTIPRWLSSSTCSPTITLDNYVHDCCRRAAEGPPSKWRDAERSLQEEMARRNPLRPSTSWQPRYGPTRCCGLEMRSATTDQPSWAFAAPGYCCDHWQLGRATMTVLGFRPVQAARRSKGLHTQSGCNALENALLVNMPVSASLSCIST